MDYLKLKQTLLAAFDHFLSCYDAHDLEEMMQGLEAGKKLIIHFPEPIHRDDYIDDVLEREEDISDDVLALKSPRPKRITSRIKRKKINATLEKIKVDVPIYMELGSLNKKQQDAIKVLLHKKSNRDTQAADDSRE